MNFNFLLYVVAMVLFAWYAFVAAEWVSVGTPGVLLGFGLFAFAGAHVAWPNRTAA